MINVSIRCQRIIWFSLAAVIRGPERIYALVMRSLSWLDDIASGIAVLPSNIHIIDQYEKVLSFVMRPDVKDLVPLRDLELNDASFREAQINYSSSQALLS